MTSVKAKSVSRPCDGCKKCCEGFLTIELPELGLHVKSGQTCPRLGKHGCNIYSLRPELCRQWECEWKSNLSIPSWLKPDQAGVIILRKELEGHRFFLVVYAGGEITDKIHNWAKELAQSKNENILVPMAPAHKVYSKNTDFIKAVKKIYLVK